MRKGKKKRVILNYIFNNIRYKFLSNLKHFTIQIFTNIFDLHEKIIMRTKGNVSIFKIVFSTRKVLRKKNKY